MAKPRPSAPTTIRTELDQDDIAMFGTKLDRFTRILKTVDPSVNAEGARLMRPDLPYFRMQSTEHGLVLWFDPNDASSAFAIEDEGLRVGDGPRDVRGLLRTIGTWRRRMRLPVYRSWAARDIRNDPIHPHARRIAAVVSAARPELHNAFASLTPPTPHSAGSIEVRHVTDSGSKILILDPALEAVLMDGVPTCVRIDSPKTASHGLSFSREADQVRSPVHHDIDPMERLRAMTLIHNTIGAGRRPLKNR